MAHAFPLDPGNEVHARALARLADEEIGWLVTQGRDGFPHAAPVWFLWHDDTVLTFSQPQAAKARNLAADPRVAFHLEAGADGEQLQILQGTAHISAEPTADWFGRVGDAYLRKYAVGLERLGWPLERMARDFTTAIVIRPHALIAW